MFVKNKAKKIWAESATVADQLLSPSFQITWRKITSFNNCFEQLNLAWQFAAVSYLAGVCNFKHFKPQSR